MSDIALVHGFATGVRYSIFRPACGMDAGFTAFKGDVENGTAIVFRWDIPKRASFWESLNPSFSLRIYATEERRIKSSIWQKKLYLFLESEQPSTIVCHSLGCFFLLEMMNRYGLPACVQTIIFNQSAAPRSADLTHPDVRNRIRSGRVQCINTYCQWDPTLWASFMLQGVLRDGLFPTQKHWMKSRWTPLLRPINLHTSAIRSSRFRRWVIHRADAFNKKADT